jgi:hypothetical protein
MSRFDKLTANGVRFDRLTANGVRFDRLTANERGVGRAPKPFGLSLSMADVAVRRAHRERGQVRHAHRERERLTPPPG